MMMMYHDLLLLSYVYVLTCITDEFPKVCRIHDRLMVQIASMVPLDSGLSQGVDHILFEYFILCTCDI
jgi:hypothetical protein